MEDASSLDGEASSSRSAQVFANKDTSWILKHHGDHVFILSEAGKPIFSRFVFRGRERAIFSFKIP